MHLNLDMLIAQLISCTHLNKQNKDFNTVSKTLKTDDNNDNKNELKDNMQLSENNLNSNHADVRESCEHDDRTDEASFSQSDVKCTHCEFFYHESSNCWLKYSEKAASEWRENNKTHIKKFKRKTQQWFHISLTVRSSTFLLKFHLNHLKLSLLILKRETKDIISAASHHLSVNFENFIELRLCNKISVTDINEKLMKSVNMSTIWLELKEFVVFIENAQYTLNISNNLISFSQLNWQEYQITLSTLSSDLYAFEITDC